MTPKNLTAEERAILICNEFLKNGGVNADSVLEQIKAAESVARKSERDRCVKIHHTAMSVWCATQFPEECSKKDREDARALKYEHSGTLGFIAASEAEMRTLPLETGEAK